MYVNRILKVLENANGTQYDFQALFLASGYKNRKTFQRKIEMFVAEGIIKQTHNQYWIDGLGKYYMKMERQRNLWIPVIISSILSAIAIVISILALTNS